VPWGPDGGQWLQGRSGEGVHACALGDLPYWLDDELWEVELDAPIFRAARQLVAAAAIDGQVGHDEERGPQVAWLADGLKLRDPGWLRSCRPGHRPRPPLTQLLQAPP